MLKTLEMPKKLESRDERFPTIFSLTILSHLIKVEGGEVALVQLKYLDFLISTEARTCEVASLRAAASPAHVTPIRREGAEA